MAGIYVHIPFCKKACHYCNFHFSTSLGLQKDFVAALLQEIDLQKSYLKEPISTIYFGGGTPSLLTAQELESIIEKLYSTFLIEKEIELTLEANPDNITQQRLQEWKRLGVNRLSIGIQSFFEEDLKWMNRAHNAQQAKDCIKLAKQEGFDNLTVDLIYGTPTLTDDNWRHNLDTAFNVDIPHLSCYALTVEPKTALEKLISAKKIDNVDLDTQAKHFEILTEMTKMAGYEQYEISNFAKPGWRSKHNSSYWQGKPYLGLGPSAHSYNGESRQWNVANNVLYIKALQAGQLKFEKEELKPTDKLNEYIMTSLRTVEGLSLKKVAERFGSNEAITLLSSAKKHIGNNTLALNNNTLQLTSAGKFLADGIASDLFVG